MSNAGLTHASAFDAITQLRGEFLRERDAHRGNRRSVLPAVFVNGADQTGTDPLHHIPASTIEEIRFVPSEEAFGRYGSQYQSGIILITVKHSTHRQ
jgi:hypothetical protein